MLGDELPDDAEGLTALREAEARARVRWATPPPPTEAPEEVAVPSRHSDPLARTEFAAMLGPEPEWVDCETCGAKTMRSRCFDCARAADARREATDRLRTALSTIPPRFSWAHVHAPELAERVRFCDDETAATTIRRVLGAQRVIFSGRSKSGKTSLACACLRLRMPDAIFVSAMRLATARIQHAAGDGEALLVERAIRTRLLLIDEVGQSKPTATDALRDVIWARFDEDRPTWVTTALSSAQLLEVYGEGLVTRLRDRAVIVRLGAAT